MFYVHLVAGLACAAILRYELRPDGSRAWAWTCGVAGIINLFGAWYHA